MAGSMGEVLDKSKVKLMKNSFDLKKTRNHFVAKDNRLIQNSRFALSNNENKAVLYLISKIKPGDTPGMRYYFNCREFQSLINWNGRASYKNIKKMITRLSDMRWWIDIDENNEALVRWFNIVHMNKGTGDIEISFHEDMFPYLLDLQQHLERDGHYFTTYKLQNVALMKNRYSPRIYEILKSYQHNNRKWTFENGTGSKYDLQQMIGDTVLDSGSGGGKPVVPASWSNWAVFKRDVLDRAIKEINKYTDIKVAYMGKKEDIRHKKTRAIRTIEFYMVEKTEPEQRATDSIIDAEYVEIADIKSKSETKVQTPDQTVEELFFAEHAQQMDLERQDREYLQMLAEKNTAVTSSHPALFAELNEERNAGMSEEKVKILYDTAIRNRVQGIIPYHTWELFATDLVIYYYERIIATPEDTQTTTYKRLLDCVQKDYDDMARDLLFEYGH